MVAFSRPAIYHATWRLHVMSNTIQKTIDLKAPVSRVWRAITDHKEFGEWFRVKIEAPFEAGAVSRGHITYPGYEHVQWQVTIKDVEPERLFSFTWHPFAVEPEVDYSSEIPTLVEFVLEAIPAGTRLTITESGFDKVPAHRRDLAFRMNEGGWTEQISNIESHLAKVPQ